MEAEWVVLGLMGIAGILAGILGTFLVLHPKRLQAEAQTNQYKASYEALIAQHEKQDETLRQQKVEQIEFQSQILDLTRELSRMQESYAQLSKEAKDREQDVGRLQKQFRLEFEQLAHDLLERNTQKLSRDNQYQLHHLLQPLKDRIEAFEKKVDHTYQQEARERFTLQKEIQKLVTLNVQMGEEARNLTRALKGDIKQQGNWGELVLIRVLEQSGLREGEEYILQGKKLGLTNEQGKRQQPDVIICLPDQKHLIIDAKVSLVAYERYLRTDREHDKTQSLKSHLTSVRSHIQLLSDKHYQDLQGITPPDFVLLFMPIESSFSLALQAQEDLFSYAWERRIVIVSPTTLLATLKTVASLWRLEHQHSHAQEIARQGGALYDKFVAFVEELEKVGTSLDRATGHYSDAMKKLRDGKGSLFTRAEALRTLGIKHRKQLP